VKRQDYLHIQEGDWGLADLALAKLAAVDLVFPNWVVRDLAEADFGRTDFLLETIKSATWFKAKTKNLGTCAGYRTDANKDGIRKLALAKGTSSRSIVRRERKQGREKEYGTIACGMGTATG